MKLSSESVTPEFGTQEFILSHLALVVGQHTGVSLEEMRGRSQKDPLVQARRLFCFLAYSYWDLSLATIGKFIARHHATVIHYHRSCKGFLEVGDVGFQKRLTRIRRDVLFRMKSEQFPLVRYYDLIRLQRQGVVLVEADQESIVQLTANFQRFVAAAKKREPFGKKKQKSLWQTMLVLQVPLMSEVPMHWLQDVHKKVTIPLPAAA